MTRLEAAQEAWSRVQTMRDAIWASGAELTPAQLAEVQAAIRECREADEAEYGDPIYRLMEADANSRTPLNGGRS